MADKPNLAAKTIESRLLVSEVAQQLDITPSTVSRLARRIADNLSIEYGGNINEHLFKFIEKAVEIRKASKFSYNRAADVACMGGPVTLSPQEARIERGLLEQILAQVSRPCCRCMGVPDAPEARIEPPESTQAPLDLLEVECLIPPQSEKRAVPSVEEQLKKALGIPAVLVKRTPVQLEALGVVVPDDN